MKLKSVLGLGCLTVAAASNAQLNHFMWTDGSINGVPASTNTDPNVQATWFGNGAGNTRLISATDNDTNKTFTFNTAIDKSSGSTANAFWLAVSSGPNPKGIAGELAMFYFDGTGSGAPKVTAYGYNGENGFTSYMDGSPAAGTQAPVKIASSLVNPNFVKSSNYTATDPGAGGYTTMGFTIDTTVIDNFNGGSNWAGMDFSNNIGIWYHPVTGANTSYGSDGYLTNFSFSANGWVDLENAKTSNGSAPVPEPASLAAIGLGLVGLVKRKRK